jgi:8-oxo-dGTP pyrophosphatase MutT (NUDIX family)
MIQKDKLKNTISEKLQSYVPKKIKARDRIPAAVIAPLFDKQGVPHILFTKRTTHLQYHRGEICFPGGSWDENDSDTRFTALRELYEEIAVPASQVEILGALDDIRTVSSYFLVVPYIGYLQEGTRFHPNEREVEQILEVPFEHFLNPSIFREETRLVDRQPQAIYYYQWEEHTIWGLTARILKMLLDLIKGEKT